MKREEFQQTAEHAQTTVRASVKNWCVVSNVREKEHRTANKKRKLELVVMWRDFSMTAPSNDAWIDAVTTDSNNVRNKVPSQLLWKKIHQQAQKWQRAGVRPERTTERDVTRME